MHADNKLQTIVESKQKTKTTGIYTNSSLTVLVAGYRGRKTNFFAYFSQLKGKTHKKKENNTN